MTRIEGTNEFSGTDAEQSFRGMQIFEGHGWSLPRWKYDIRLKDGSGISGTGSLDAEGIKTVKTISDSAGTPTVLMREDLRTISADEYAKRRQELFGETP